MLRYHSEIEATFEGELLPRVRAWHTDVYERRAGGWQVGSQATEIS